MSRDDTPQTHTDYTPRILEEDVYTQCRFCGSIFPNEIEAMTENTFHGTAYFPDCPLKKVYAKYINGIWTVL